MSNCRCHAGKICDLHVEEVMGNLNERLKDRKNYHDSEEGLMSPNSIDDFTQPTPEQIEHDILENLKSLRERATLIEKMCADHLAYIENLIRRVNDVEGRLNGIELSRLRGNG